MDIIAEMKKGNKRAVARLISMIENHDVRGTDILKELWRYENTARIIGITGPPGAGKSTLTDQLAKLIIKRGEKVGIIAVDPSSPITGGALLGDRVRMSDLNAEPNCFIRSMGTRGALGGISRAVHGAIRALEAFGMDYVFVETVGVGQSEVDIASVADTVVMVAVPGLGDDIQAGKAGILEVVDVIAVNKADHEGADRTVQSLKYMLGLDLFDTSKKSDMDGEPHEGVVIPEIVLTVATSGKGIEELAIAINAHQSKIKSSGKIDELHRRKLRSELAALVASSIVTLFAEFDKESNILNKALEEIIASKADPYSKVEGLVNDFLHNLSEKERKNAKKS